MKNESILKINKIGKAGSIIALIMKIFLIIGFVGCLVGFIAVMVLPANFVTFEMNGKAKVNVNTQSLGVQIPEDEVKESIKEDIKEGGYISINDNKLEVSDVDVTTGGIKIQADGQISNFSMRSCAYAIFIGMIYVGMSFVTVLFAGFLAKAFANCDSPFEENVIRKMKNFAYSLIPWTVISGVSNAVMSNMFSNGKHNFNLSINLSYVFIVLIILALAFIFQYGAELQKESDETL